MYAYRLILTAIIVGVYGASAVVAVIIGPTLPQQWLRYALPAIIVSAALVFPHITVHLKESVRIVLLASQFLLSYVIIQPLGSAVGLEALITAAVGMSAALYGTPVTAAAMGLVLLISTLSRTRELQIWDTITVPPEPYQILVIVVLTTAVTSITLVASLGDRSRRRVLRSGIAQEQTIHRLVEANMEYQRYALEIEQSAQQAERTRVTREIHDSIGYAFTNQRMVLEAATVLLDRDPTRLRLLVGDAQNSLTEGYQDIRAALHRLRRVDRTHQSLEARILHLAQHFSAVSGVTIVPQILIQHGRVTPAAEEALFRCAQEGITNAFCHGQAKTVTVILRSGSGSVHLTVLDDGRGAETITEGIGLRGMRERLEPMGGSVKATPMARGFSLQITLPEEGTT